jgi:hypothetical protein
MFKLEDEDSSTNRQSPYKRPRCLVCETHRNLKFFFGANEPEQRLLPPASIFFVNSDLLKAEWIDEAQPRVRKGSKKHTKSSQKPTKIHENHPFRQTSGRRTRASAVL